VVGMTKSRYQSQQRHIKGMKVCFVAVCCSRLTQHSRFQKENKFLVRYLIENWGLFARDELNQPLRTMLLNRNIKK
jgi:hypothetical protein